MSAPTVLVVNPGADVYGSDLQMLESISAMVEVGWHVHAVVPEPGPLVGQLVDRGASVEVMGFPIVRRSYMSARGVLRLGLDVTRTARPMLRAIKRSRADAVYVNTTTIPWWIVGARVARVPVLCHVHEAETKDGGLVLKALHAPLLLADRLILISDTALEAVCAVIPRLRRRSTLVRNGVPDRPDPPVDEPSTANGFHLAVLARLSPRKAPDVAIDATRLLVERGYNARLELAGSHFPGYEWYVHELHAKVIKADIEDRVTFSGHVSPPYLVFDRSHVVLAPSLREPFGNSVVEAQLSQRPVVAAAAGGHLESINDGETGVLVSPGDAAATADAVAALLEDEAHRRSIGQRARTGAIERFGIARYRREIVEVISRQLRQAGTASSRPT